MRVSKVFGFFLVEQGENPTFRADFSKKSTSIDLLLGTFWEQLNNVDRHFPSIATKYHHPLTFSVEMHSTFVMVNESFSVESSSLQDEVRYIRPIFPFFR